jgi:hypothetical protein
MKHQNEQQKLKGLVRELERELSEEKSQVKVLEETQERLRQAESICQELANENRGLREEIADWEGRFVASEENQRQISLLHEQLGALQAEHARVIDSNREIQEKLTFHSERGKIPSPVEGDRVAAMVPQNEINAVAPIASDLTGSGEANDNPFLATDPTAKTNVAKKNPTEMLWGLFVQNRHLGAIFAGVIVLIVAATVAVKILRTDGPVAKNTTSGAEAMADEQEARPVSKSSTLAAPRVQGTFQTVRATQVFSEPSEDSALVAEIDKGVKINVVGSREGWLEIRSKHGRPPGFIRQEETVRIGRNPQ